MNEFITTIQYIVSQTQQHLAFLLILIASLFAVLIVSKLTGNRLLLLGIHPRRLIGLPGIFCAPFLHGNFNHLFFNAIPLLVLGDFVLLFGQTVFLKVTLAIIVLSGSLTWLLGRPAIHIGASSLITGYWSFLLINMYQQGGVMNIILGVICVYYFAGIFLGIFPSEKGVSWEGHLFGLIAGIATSYLLPFCL